MPGGVKKCNVGWLSFYPAIGWRIRTSTNGVRVCTKPKRINDRLDLFGLRLRINDQCFRHQSKRPAVYGFPDRSLHVTPGHVYKRQPIGREDAVKSCFVRIFCLLNL